MKCSTANSPELQGRHRSRLSQPSERGRSEKSKQLLRSVAWIVLLAQLMLPGAVGMDEKPQQVAMNHGSVMARRQLLVHSSDASRLLAIVDRQLELDNTSAAIDALQALFEAEDSDFPIQTTDGEDSTAYAEGIRRLQSATYAFRSEWFRKMEVIARVQLQQAGSGIEAVRQVAKRFPYTESGLHANLIDIRSLVSHRQYFIAAAATNGLQRRYAGTTVPFPANSLLRPIVRRLKHLTHDLNAPVGVATAIPKSQGDANVLSSWQSVWNWSENVWENPQIAGTFAGMTQPSARIDLVDNSWHPSFVEEGLITRTPHRIVCLDLESGRPKWSIQTDTVSEGVQERLKTDKRLTRQASPVSMALRKNDLGNVSATDGFVFFVDHFRVFEQQNGPREILNFRFNRNPGPAQTPEFYGKRLVAVRLTSEPSIAWTVGEASDFKYAVTTDGDSAGATKAGDQTAPLSEEQPDLGNEQPSTDVNQFDGHRFLGPPLVFEQSLFVLTSHDESIWLNCLMKGTGRLTWRRSIAYVKTQDDDPANRFLLDKPATAASVVGIQGETLLCLLNTGIVVGAALYDGQVQWATSLKSVDVNTAPIPAAYLYSRSFRNRPVMPPVLHQGRLIWSAPDSEKLFCLDAETGVIQWQRSMSAEGPGQVGQSRDLLPAGIHNGHLLMTGVRHLRAIRITDGAVAWTTPLNRPIGKAVLMNGFAWVPTLSGRVVPVELASGEKQSSLPASSPVVGSLYRSGNTVVATTPVSVQAFPVSSPTLPKNSEVTEVAEWRQAFVVALNALMTSQIPDDEKEFLESLGRLPQQQQQMLAEQILNSVESSEVPELFSRILDRLVRTEMQDFRFDLLNGRARQFNGSDPLVRVAEDHAVAPALARYRTNQPASYSDLSDRPVQLVIQPAVLQQAALQEKNESLESLAISLWNDRPAAAELALLQQRNLAVQPDKITRTQNNLQRLRNGDLPVEANSDEIRSQTEQSVQALAPDSRTLRLKFKADETLALVVDHPMAQLARVGRQRQPVDVGSVWPSRRILLGERKLFSVDLDTGSVAQAIKLPDEPDDLGPKLSRKMPTLLPLVGSSHVGVVSLVNPSKPQQLWRRRWPRRDYDSSPLKSGPVTSVGMIFVSDHQLTCHHPLTGRLLWAREYCMGSVHGPFGRLEQFAADDQHLIAFGAGYQSGTVYRMNDGTQVRELEYDHPAGLTPLLSGTRLLSVKNEQLILLDLVTGENLLQDQKIRILPSSPSRLLDDHRAVVLSDDRKITILNLLTAKIERQYSVPEELYTRSFRDFRVFEDGDQLFVNFRDSSVSRRQASANSVVGDRQIPEGVLLVIDRNTGKRWSTVNVTSVMMYVAGDPSPFLVLWTRQRGLSESRTFRRMQQNQVPLGTAPEYDSLELKVLNRFTGELMWSSDQLAWGNPLHCVHESESRTITVQTDASEIVLRYTDAPDESE